MVTGDCQSHDDDEDDDVIEILDSPIKPSARSHSKRHSEEDVLAPVFNMFTKPEPGPSRSKNILSSPVVKQETGSKVATKTNSVSTARSEKRRMDDERAEDRAVKKPRSDPLKQAQP